MMGRRANKAWKCGPAGGAQKKHCKGGWVRPAAKKTLQRGLGSASHKGKQMKREQVGVQGTPRRPHRLMPSQWVRPPRRLARRPAAAVAAAARPWRGRWTFAFCRRPWARRRGRGGAAAGSSPAPAPAPTSRPEPRTAPRRAAPRCSAGRWVSGHLLAKNNGARVNTNGRPVTLGASTAV